MRSYKKEILSLMSGENLKAAGAGTLWFIIISHTRKIRRHCKAYEEWKIVLIP